MPSSRGNDAANPCRGRRLAQPRDRTATVAAFPLPPALPQQAPSATVGGSADWTNLVSKTTALFASSMPPTLGGAADKVHQAAARMSNASNDAEDHSVMATAMAAAQADIAAVSPPATLATAKQAGDRAGQ